MKNNETGRSMVEMLGVLAIIGVLSVAGIAGYSMAMKKIKVNDILSIASQCSILARTYQGIGATTATSCTALGIDPDEIPSGISSASFTGKFEEAVAGQNGHPARVVVNLTAEDNNQCSQLKQMVANTSTCNGSAATLYFLMD
ncbi:MAG: hypothetical protein IKQ99_02875 [Alphaproteobacteria bacterium]|nr:hypothetical protein [Alphaproteobacteria bacterium]